MSDLPAAQPSPLHIRMGLREWLIVVIAAVGFAFDIYELLMMPLIAPSAIADLYVDPATGGKVFESDPRVREWFSYLLYVPAIFGGVFGLLGGYLTDYFGRRRVLVFSILLYAGSALGAGFATDLTTLLILRCTTFVGVCVEFVAAIAWLAELFPEPRQRERVLGYTQAFSSVGGLLVSAVYLGIVQYQQSLPEIYGSHTPWRYMLISGVLPALPLILVRPFLPESPVWQAKAAAGTLHRPSFAAIFSPALRRATIASTILFACAYGAAFGAIQQISQIVPGLMPEAAAAQKAARAQFGAAKKAQAALLGTDAPQAQRDEADRDVKAADAEVKKVSRPILAATGRTQLWQETGGLLGRFALALVIAGALSKARLLRGFIVPGLVVAPLVFLLAGTGRLGENSLTLFQVGIFAVGFLTVAQFSFLGNYLPTAYPVHLRGTGEGFAANVGGRLVGTSAAGVTGYLSTLMPVEPQFQVAAAAGVVALGVYLVALAASFWLPETRDDIDRV